MSELSYLEKLLDGVDVEWVSLGDIGNFIRGNGLQKKDFVESGFPAIHYGQIYTMYGLSADKTFNYVSPELANKLRKAQKNDLLLATTSENDEDVVKPLAWLGNEAAISGDMMLFRHQQNVKYLAHFFRSEIFQTQKMKYITGAKVRRVSSADLAKFKTPIPCPNDPGKSFVIQSEIVRILDKFNALTAELTAELTMRKKQYNFYRDQLLSFEEGKVEWKTLGDEDLFHIGSGGTPSKSKPEYWDNGTIPWLKSESCNNEPVHVAKNFISELGLKKSSAKLLPKKTTLIALVGATIFKTAFLEFEATTNQNIASIKSIKEGFINDKFIYYFLTNLYDKLKSEMRNYGMLNLTNLRQFRIPVPSMDQQKRIVSILDKFDTLTNSITEGLPREIELRQKQYEYYRDMLFSFPKPEAAEA
ncbi:restriction endonuclease subunit S [Erwinia psidii]|uniref:restriction endonuclease subunit S n=1 Tax=Erwinia psidii TaxID=69224 RepID=UPI00226B83F4|nr:restriction endonuclease subunit S [Erwinia psidii]MCX8967129.1 restriction endonuclease subunit S [Erwinia psidii]